MARKRGTNPYTKLGKNVFPVVNFRNNLVTAADDTPVYEEVDLGLQTGLEDNLVFDIMAVETWMDPTGYDESVADGAIDIHCALLDNPGETSLNLDTDAVFESTEEIIYYDHHSWLHTLGTAGGFREIQSTMHKYQKFDEPFVVARNVAWTITLNQTTVIFTGAACNLRAMIYGRKRRAPDSEYKNLLYRIAR